MEKIAIIRRNGLGDLICATPLILYLRKKYPHCQITLFVDPRNAPLLSYLPKVDEVVVFPKKGNKYLNLLGIALKFRKKFDLAISCKTSPMKLMNFFLFFLGAKKSRGYIAKKWHRFFINEGTFYEKQTKHQALKTLHLLDPNLKSIPEELYPTFHLNPFTPLIETNLPLLLLSASTTRAASRFEETRYTALVNHLSEHSPFEVVLIGEKKDRERFEKIAQGLKVKSHLYFPRTFQEFMVLLYQADLYFVGDGGIAHIGALFEKEEVVLFGETDPLNWAPLNRRCECLFDPHDVNALSDEAIFKLLTQKLERVQACKKLSVRSI